MFTKQAQKDCISLSKVSETLGICKKPYLEINGQPYIILLKGVLMFGEKFDSLTFYFNISILSLQCLHLFHLLLTTNAN